MIAGAVLGAVVLAVVAFFVGHGVRSPTQIAASARAPTPSLITAPVRSIRARLDLVLRGTVTTAGEAEVRAPAALLGGDLPVVTAVPYRRGAAVSSGTAVVAVAGHPLIVLSGSIPAYREFAYGESGTDIQELQSALEGVGLSVGDDSSGKYGLGTAAAVAELYAKNGYAAPTSPVSLPTGRRGKHELKDLATVPLGEFVFLSDLPGRIVSAAHAGETLKANGVAIKIGTGAPGIAIKVDANEATLIRTGDRGRAVSNASGASMSGRVSSVGRTGPARGTGAPRYVIRFTPNRASAAESLVGQNLEVQIRLNGTRATKIMVPDGAVVTSANGQSNVVTVHGRHQAVVKVRVLMSYEGAEIVKPLGAELKAGERVVVGND